MFPQWAWGMAVPIAYGIFTPAPWEPPFHMYSHPSQCSTSENEAEADNSGGPLPVIFFEEAVSTKALHEPSSISEIQTKQKWKMENRGQVPLKVCEWSTHLSDLGPLRDEEHGTLSSDRLGKPCSKKLHLILQIDPWGHKEHFTLYWAPCWI